MGEDGVVVKIKGFWPRGEWEGPTSPGDRHREQPPVHSWSSTSRVSRLGGANVETGI